MMANSRGGNLAYVSVYGVDGGADGEPANDAGGAASPQAMSETAAPANLVIEMARGYQLSQALHAAAELGIADLLSGGARPTSELARATGSDEAALHRLLRLLASRGIFRAISEHAFDLTELGHLLRRDVQGSLRSQVLHWGHATQQAAFAELAHSLRSGEPAFERVFGMGHWDYLASDAPARELFKAAMAAHPSHAEVPAAYDFSKIASIVDIGGGNGQLLAEILRAHPHMSGVLLDRPVMVAGARRSFALAGLGERCKVIGGDFFVAIPRAAEAYILSNVLMDWSDAEAERLLWRCREAMLAGSRLLIVERLLPMDHTASLGQLCDLAALVTTGGRCRTAAEFDRLLTAAGMRLGRMVMTPSGFSILEARPRQRD
jgi:hypothetical protein